MARIAAVGEIVEDHYLDDGTSYLGGISVNFARCAHFAGAAAAVYAPLGDDARGDRLMAALARTEISARVRAYPGLTPQQHITVGADGERRFCGFEAGVLSGYEPNDEELDELARYDAVAVPCSRESRRAFRRLAAAGWSRDRLVADFSQDSPDDKSDQPASWIEPWADRLRIAFVGADAGQVEPLSELSRRAVALIVLTAGKDGAFAFAAGRSWHQPSVATCVVDTTGCGDAFQAGFTVRYLEGQDVASSLRAGAELAARVAEHRSGAPWPIAALA